MEKVDPVIRLIMHTRPVELGLFLKRILRIKRVKREIGGIILSLDPASAFGRCLITSGYYEPGMTAAIEDLLSEGDTFIDLGGNEGYFSVIAAKKVGKTGKVFCLEPQERLWSTIFRNLYYNDITQCVLLPYAISNSRGVAKIVLAPSLNTGASSLAKSNRSLCWPKQEVISCSLDEISHSYEMNRVKLIKIDIEGYELNALHSAADLLTKKKIRNILIEIHPHQLRLLKQTPEEVFELLTGYGYTHTQLHGVDLFYA